MGPIQKKIFICGTGRCGTTWVGRWLSHHPLVFGGHETHLFKLLSDIYNKEWEQGIKTWVSEDLLFKTFQQFSDTLFGNYLHRKESQIHLVEHSPVHYQMIDFIKRVYPDALFIHLYRDGRNVTESKIRTTGKINLVSEFIENWVTTIEDMLNRSDPNILNVQYEKLMTSPETCSAITDFLDINLHFVIDSWEFPVNTSNFSYDPNRWKKMPQEAIRLIESSTMPDLLRKLDYD